MIFKRALLVGLAFALLAPGSLASPAHAGGACIGDWSKAAPIIRNEKLASAATVAKLAKKRQIGRLLSITLCQKQNNYVYRLVVSNNKGQIRTVEVDARKPFSRP